MGLHDGEACRPAPQGATGQDVTPLGRLQGKGNKLLLATLAQSSADHNSDFLGGIRRGIPPAV